MPNGFDPPDVLTVGTLRAFLSALTPEADDVPVYLEVFMQEEPCRGFQWLPFDPDEPRLLLRDKKQTTKPAKQYQVWTRVAQERCLSEWDTKAGAEKEVAWQKKYWNKPCGVDRKFEVREVEKHEEN